MAAKKLNVETPESKALASLEDIAGQIIPVVNELQSVKRITSDAEQSAVDETLTAVKITRKRLEEDRKSFVDPLNQIVKRINARYKPVDERLEEAEHIYKRLLATRLNELREAEVARAEKEAKKAEKAGAGELAHDIRETALTKNVAPSLSGVTMRTNYRCEVIDVSKVPREYLIPDEKKLNAMARALKEDFKIPGCKLIIDETINKSV